MPHVTTQEPTPNQVLLIDLPSYIHTRSEIFPPHVVESLRVQFPDMARTIEALMNTVELLLYINEFPVGVDKVLAEGLFALLSPSGTMAQVRTPVANFVAPDFMTAIINASRSDPAFQALRDATDNFTRNPDEPVDVVAIYDKARANGDG